MCHPLPSWLPASQPAPLRHAHLVTCLWKSVSCLCVTWMAPPVVSFGKPFSEFSSQRQNVWRKQEKGEAQDMEPNPASPHSGLGEALRFGPT